MLSPFICGAATSAYAGAIVAAADVEPLYLWGGYKEVGAHEVGAPDVEPLYLWGGYKEIADDSQLQKDVEPLYLWGGYKNVNRMKDTIEMLSPFVCGAARAMASAEFGETAVGPWHWQSGPR